MTTKLTKLLALALAFVMVLGLFAACAKTETPAQTPAETPETPAETPAETPEAPAETPQTPAEEEKEPVTIRFWQAGGDTVSASTIMRLLLDQFENDYPWITVDYQAIPWSNDPETMFSTGIASGDIADVLVVGDSKAFILASEGNILPLDDMLTEETKDDMIDVLKVDSVYNSNLNPDMTGKTIYAPLYGGTRAILYNKEIFDYFGVDYPTESMTHAELLEMAKQLTGDMDGKHVYGYGTRATTSEQWISFVWDYGGEIIDTATMSAATDSEAWTKGVSDYMAFYEAGVVPEGASAMDASTLLNMFVNGEVAMFWAAVDYAQAIRVEEGWEEKLGVAALPHEDYSTCYTGADVLVVPAATQHPEEAALLLNYLLSTDAQATYCKNVGFFPSVKSASAADAYFTEDPIQQAFAAAMEGCHFYGNYGVSTGSILRANIQMFLNGDYTMEEFQEHLTEEINTAIQENFG